MSLGIIVYKVIYVVTAKVDATVYEVYYTVFAGVILYLDDSIVNASLQIYGAVSQHDFFGGIQGENQETVVKVDFRQKSRNQVTQIAGDINQVSPCQGVAILFGKIINSVVSDILS